MKKILLSLSLVLAAATAQGQNLLTENFDVFPAGPAGTWTQTNQSSPVGASTWAQGGGTAFATAFNGGATSFTLCNFNSTTGAGTISNWLMSPVVSLQNGDVVSFYSRTGGLTTDFADRLELRISTNGAFTAAPSGGSAGLGDYTTLALTINPNLNLTDYPLAWTQFSYTVSGLPTATDCKIGLRYFVTDGGPAGNNSNIIGVDAFSVDRPLSTEGFFASNFAVYPNPATNVLNINTKGSTSMNQIQLTDINGRIVKTVNAAQVSETQINIGDLNSGVYFLKISSDLGVGTSKIIKN